MLWYWFMFQLRATESGNDIGERQYHKSCPDYPGISIPPPAFKGF